MHLPFMMKTTFLLFFWYLLCQKRVFGHVFDDLTGLLIIPNYPVNACQNSVELSC